MRLVGMSDNLITRRLVRSSIMRREEFEMSDVDTDVLRNFLSKSYQTLGDILTINPEEGSNVMTSVQKLVRFGLLQRDWELEHKMKEDVIYAITREGKELIAKELEKLQSTIINSHQMGLSFGGLPRTT